MAKIKLNQYDEIKRRHAAREADKKKFDLKGAVAMSEKRKREPKPAKCKTMYDANGYFNPHFVENWLAPTSKEP